MERPLVAPVERRERGVVAGSDRRDEILVGRHRRPSGRLARDAGRGNVAWSGPAVRRSVPRRPRPPRHDRVAKLVDDRVAPACRTRANGGSSPGRNGTRIQSAPYDDGAQQVEHRQHDEPETRGRDRDRERLRRPHPPRPRRVGRAGHGTSRSDRARRAGSGNSGTGWPRRGSPRRSTDSVACRPSDSLLVR